MPRAALTNPQRKFLMLIADAENGQGNVRSEVNLAILRCLNELKVEIPFPQRVLRQAEPWRTEVAAQGADVPPR